MKRNKLFLPASLFPEYNNAVDRYMMASKIFNGGAEKVPSVHTIFFDRRGIEAYILELEGDEESGKFIKGSEVVLARIPTEKAKLSEIAMRFENYKVNRVNQGFEEPKVYPKELLSEYYEVNARLDVYCGELEELKKHLDEFKDEVEQESTEDVLKWGLRGFSKLRHGVIEKIDGQKCSITDSGVVIIDDIRSPYDHMAVSDYRKLAKQWNLDRADADRKKLLRNQQQAKSEGKQIPQALPVKSMLRVSINNLPKWPDWAKNYKEVVNDDSTFTTK